MVLFSRRLKNLFIVHSYGLSFAQPHYAKVSHSKGIKLRLFELIGGLNIEVYKS